MRILLDVDGVICNFIAHWRTCARAVLDPEWLSKRFACPPNPDSWNLGERYGLGPGKMRRVERELYTRSALGMLAMPKAIECVHRLMREHDVYFVTTSLYPHQTWDSDRRRWFDLAVGHEASKRLIFCAAKHVCSGDIFVDDKLENCQQWQAANPDGRSILFIGDTTPQSTRPDNREWALDWPVLMSMLMSGPGNSAHDVELTVAPAPGHYDIYMGEEADLKAADSGPHCPRCGAESDSPDIYCMDCVRAATKGARPAVGGHKRDAHGWCECGQRSCGSGKERVDEGG